MLLWRGRQTVNGDAKASSSCNSKMRSKHPDDSLHRSDWIHLCMVSMSSQHLPVVANTFSAYMPTGHYFSPQLFTRWNLGEAHIGWSSGKHGLLSILWSKLQRYFTYNPCRLQSLQVLLTFPPQENIHQWDLHRTDWDHSLMKANICHMPHQCQPCLSVMQKKKNIKNFRTFSISPSQWW